MAAQPVFNWEPMSHRDSVAKPVQRRQEYCQPALPAARVWEEEFPTSEYAEIDALPQILAQIDHLIVVDEEDKDITATEYAYRAARSVVESAYGRLRAEKRPISSSIPDPVITIDERGGIKVSWQMGNKHVRTAFAAAQGQRSYLYFESPTEHDAIDLQPSNLSGKLDWMLKP